MQADLTVEVAADQNGCNPGEDGLGLGGDEAALLVRISAHEVGFVVGVSIDRTVKGRGPVEMCCVEVRVRDDDCFQAAVGVDLSMLADERWRGSTKSTYEFDGLFAEIGETIPKHISVWCLDQHRSLANTQLCRPCQRVSFRLGSSEQTFGSV